MRVSVARRIAHFRFSLPLGPLNITQMRESGNQSAVSQISSGLHHLATHCHTMYGPSLREAEHVMRPSVMRQAINKWGEVQSARLYGYLPSFAK